VIPSVEGRLARPFLGVEAVFVSRRSKHKEAAIEAARLLAGAASAKIRMERGKQPVAHKATLDAGARADPTLAVFLAQASHAVPMSSRPEMQLVWSTMDMAIHGIVFGGKDPKAALDAAQKKVASDMSKRGK
jgi:maltose-binding protein MalE